MKINFLNGLKSGLAVVAFAVLAVSCSKDKAVAPASNDATANSKLSVNTVSPINTYTITGRYGNPASGPAVYGTVYVNLATGAQDTLSNTVGANVLFTSTNNSVIQVPAGYTLKFLYNTSKTLATLKTSDFAAAAVASVGRNTSTTATPNGWYNYVIPAGVTPISGVYVLITPPSGNSYALQVTAAVGQGSATSNRGVYTIKSGVINNL
jgi:hypothetical protein